MKIVIACDHSGIQFKENLIEFLKNRGDEVVDAGVDSETSVDYPDVVVKAIEVFRASQFDKLILLCGTGIGVNIAANKHRGIRCALVRDVFSAKMATQHNHANAIALGVRVDYAEPVEEVVEAFLVAEPEYGRHQNRVNKLNQLDSL